LDCRADKIDSIGRADDVIILANGEKIVPGPTEGTILAHPSVHGVVMFGRERNQAGLLVEPAEKHMFDPADEAALVAFRNEIWPAVEEANRTAPAFGRVFKEMILATKPGKPLPRVGKGSISRKRALMLYDQEIAALCVRLLNSFAAQADVVLDMTLSSIQREDPVCRLRRHGRYMISRDGLLSLRTLFTRAEKYCKMLIFLNKALIGKLTSRVWITVLTLLCSLSATFLRNNIVASLRASGEISAAQKVGNGFVYANPVLTGMAHAISALVAPSTGAEDTDPTAAIKNMISRYSGDMPILNTEDKVKPNGEVVLLTGSTGGLGSQLLATLLVDERVKKVYALNRPSTKKTSMARHEDTFADRSVSLVESSESMP
jgi:hypothetical protein